MDRLSPAIGSGERAGDAPARWQRRLSGEVTAQRGGDASDDDSVGVHGPVERAGGAEFAVQGGGGSAAAGGWGGGLRGPGGVVSAAGSGRRDDRSVGEGEGARGSVVPTPSGRIDWARLMWRVWAIDTLLCPGCGGRMKMIAALTDRAGIVRVLEHLDVSVKGRRPAARDDDRLLLKGTVGRRSDERAGRTRTEASAMRCEPGISVVSRRDPPHQRVRSRFSLTPVVHCPFALASGRADASAKFIGSTRRDRRIRQRPTERDRPWPSPSPAALPFPK